jgi:predicted DCC family thiol-disulfide oxidoreductase YuxK
VNEFSEAGPILLFDGVCNLCNAAVRFVLDHEKRPELSFASLESGTGRKIVKDAFGEEEVPDSLVLFEDGGIYVRSEAALRIARRLGGPWGLLGVFRAIPRPVRDLVYDLVAKHRYRWFGRLQRCPVPAAEVRDRFLG